MDGQQLQKLMGEVATRLIKKPTRVRLQHPTVDRARGQFYRTLNDSAIIDIDPTLKFDNMFSTFTHEVAHGMLDFWGIQPNLHHLREEGSVKNTPAEWAARKSLPLEKRANELGAKLEKFAKSRACDIYVADSDPAIVGWLKALLTYPR